MFSNLIHLFRTRRPARPNRLSLEALEDRTLLSTFMVDRLSDTGEGSDLAGDLRYCISHANDGDSIQFGVQGIINLMGALPDLSHSISIDGPGPDQMTVRRDTGGKYRIFAVRSRETTVEISGLTVTNSTGGGILNVGTMSISNCNLSGNSTDAYGGAIDNRGTLTVSNSTLSGNSTVTGNSSNGGSAIFSSGVLEVSNSTISGNTSIDPDFGPIYIEKTATINNCIISGNKSHGSSIQSYGTVTISNSTISGNTGDRGFVGGISNAQTLTVSNSTISGNNGGGINNSGTLTVSNSTISGNNASADDSAGGIFNSGTLTVSNSTISSNTGGGANLEGAAGAILNVSFLASNATVTLVNSTIANNTATGSSRIGTQLFSGHYRTGSGKATVQFRNTIISGDGSRPNLFAGTGGSFVSQGHNLSSDGGSGFLTGPGDLINSNPLLGPLQDNGGPTQTMALLPGSPAVDAGDNTDAPNFDQRGYVRIVGGTIDIGAFEAQIGPAKSFQVSAPAEVTSGAPFDVTVTALDAYDHIATGYLGTVTFSSSDVDPGVMLPSDYTFRADDLGVHVFMAGVTLITVGSQTLTITDTADGTIAGNAAVSVDPGQSPPPGSGVTNMSGDRLALTVSATADAMGDPQVDGRSAAATAVALAAPRYPTPGG